ncbi:MAG: hypothetical protein E6G45_13905 [Actinobacteria bacterium]|nr:MAG: hypothetical protein E6G45_13905 [Actinomycetota bacterium]
MSQEPHDLVASYALDALEEDERASFERHLAECERCSAQLAELQGSVGALAYAAEGPSPPAALRGKILDAARADRGAEVMFRRRSWALPAVAAIAAAAAMVAIGLGIWATSLSRSLDNERDAKAAYDRAARLLAAKATATPLSGADGSLLVAPDGRAAIVICGLGSAPSEKTYEAWVIRGTTPQPAGLFRGGSHCAPVLLTRSVSSGSTVAVTVERAGGVTKPTGRILFHAARA